MSKDTRTAWYQEFSARREGWDTINQLKAELKKVTAERDALKSSLAKRDLEQQAKGVSMALGLESWSVMNTYAIPVEDLYELEQDLRKQANKMSE